MRLIGLAAPMRCGKDTIADYLVESHDFLKFSFSDALYNEVQKSYGLESQDVLRDATTKERDWPSFALARCDNEEFRQACANAEFGDRIDLGPAEYHAFLHCPRSPRWVLQQWGTAYRRTQDPDYWIKRADDFCTAFISEYQRLDEAREAGAVLSPAEHELLQVRGLVNSSVRFENECEWLRAKGGEVWHIYRREAEAKHLDTYVSEQRLPVAEDDREIFNNGSIEKLHTGVSLVLNFATRYIHIED